MSDENKTLKSLSIFDLKTLSVCSLNKDFDDETNGIIHTDLDGFERVLTR